jgi:hypothetical protein
MDQVETSHTASSWRALEVFPSTVTGAQTSSELTWGRLPSNKGVSALESIWPGLHN